MLVIVLAGVVVLLVPLLLEFEFRDLFFFPDFELLEPWLDEPWSWVERLPDELLELPADRELELIVSYSFLSQ